MLDVISETFLSQDCPITMEVFRSGEIPQPAILLLHGGNGLKAHHDWHRGLATVLAENGYAVFFVHYFERTGTGLANREIARECFLLWRKTIIDAVAFIAGHAGVIGDRMGMLGLSLGATVALSVAGQLPQIRAAAVFSSEVPDAGWGFITSLPPTFIVHGAADQVIPVAQAHKAERWLKERKIPCEIKIYPEEGHFFRKEAVDDSVALAIAFFHRYVDPSPPAEHSDTLAIAGEQSELRPGKEMAQSGSDLPTPLAEPLSEV